MKKLSETKTELLSVLFSLSAEEIDAYLCAMDRGEVVLCGVSAEIAAKFRAILCGLRAARAGGVT